MRVQFDDVSTSGPDPVVVAYRCTLERVSSLRRHLEHAPDQGGYRHHVTCHLKMGDMMKTR